MEIVCPLEASFQNFDEFLNFGVMKSHFLLRAFSMALNGTLSKAPSMPRNVPRAMPELRIARSFLFTILCKQVKGLAEVHKFKIVHWRFKLVLYHLPSFRYK